MDNICDICNKIFSSKSKVKRHKNNIHLKLKPYECNKCGFKCSQKENLKVHSCGGEQENKYQQILEELKNGTFQITPIGVIDILTETEIIEIKMFAHWQKSIGQILSYSYYYPEHNKKIYFFGNKLSKEKEKILKVIANNSKIKLYYFDDNDEIYKL
jgi:hypothetical protein